MSVAPGRLFDLQHYSVHDGPGIRTVVFLKGCPLRCLWCSNPESQDARPQLRHFMARCRACLECRSACPAGAVTAEEGRRAPRFDRARCEACGDWRCVEACPNEALAIAGYSMAAEAVADRVAADVDFYRNSGGGVTFSGGEPLAQPGFLADLLRACRARGVHTAVETCGHAPAEVLDAVEPLVDLFLFDLKAADDALHRRLTGAGNALVLGNLRRLCERAPGKVLPRLPLIPGLNDGAEALAAMADLLASLGLRHVELVPHHPLGRAKYAELGMACPAPEGLGFADSARAVGLLSQRGLRCEIA